MKYVATYVETPEGEVKTIIMEGDFTLIRQDVDAGSIGWDSTGGRNELRTLRAGSQRIMSDDLGITSVHTVGKPAA